MKTEIINKNKGPQKLTCSPKSTASTEGVRRAQSRLLQWPCQIGLVPENAPYFDGADLLVAADCTAFAHGAFHDDVMKNHITLIGCSRIGEQDYTEKLTRIIKENNIKSVRIVRMEVQCCDGIESSAKRAIKESGKLIPWQVITVSTNGKILD